MTDTVATYSFVPWVRRGVITLAGPAGAQPAPRASVTVSVSVNDADPQSQARVALHFYGPGDVIGIDQRLIVRATPAPQSSSFEPNYFPAIEFAHPAFPWLFTPLGVGNQDEKLLPWICLVVVRKQDGVTVEMDPARPLPTLTISDPARPDDELPDLTESWAWAHGHASWATDSKASPGDLADRLRQLMRDNPNQVVSRLLCPRRLRPREGYYACVVPSFDLGRRAGLGELTANDEKPGSLEPAWKLGNVPTPFRLPLYYYWEFTAGAAGDFASVVRRIRSRKQDELQGVGQRLMDASHAADALAMPGILLGLEGALQLPDTQPSPWDADSRGIFEKALTAMLDAPSNALTSSAPPAGPPRRGPPGDTPGAAAPILAPPLYGEWLAQQTTVPAHGQPPVWLRELNLDPRNRAAAAFGTAVVQSQQEQILASAWEQLADLEQFNRVLRHTQLARTIGQSLHERHLSPVAPGALFQIARPALARMGAPPSAELALASGLAPPTRSFLTFQRLIADSAVTAGAVSSTFRAIARPRGPLVRRLFPGAAPVGARVIERLNTKQIVAAPPRKPPDGMIALDAVSQLLSGSGNTYKHLRYAAVDEAAVEGAPGWAKGWTWHNAGLQTRLRRRPAGEDSPPPPDVGDPNSSDGQAERVEFRVAARQHQAYLLAAVAFKEQPADKVSLDMATVQTQLLNVLDPHAALLRRVQGRVTSSDTPWIANVWGRADPLDPLLATPTFPQPMLEPLREISSDLIVPGLEHLPPDTMALLTPNHRFIEAYLIGLNHEVHRMLLFRGYPGGQTGTPFRHFWDLSGAPPTQPASPDCPTGEDIPPVRSWDPKTSLGDHVCGSSTAAQLVLLLSSEALARYPSAAIYAAKAVPNTIGNGPSRVPSHTEEQYPLYRVDVGSTVTCLGFALTGAEACGNDGGLGWFLVIAQHPFAPLFGLAATKGTIAKWSDLSWDDLDATWTHVRASAPSPGPETIKGVMWGASAGHMAAITSRPPVRVARHASLMLSCAT